MSTVIWLISLFLIAIALMLLGADAVTSLERGGEVTVRSLGEVWGLFDKAGMEGFKAWADHSLPKFLSQSVYSALSVPGWGITGVPGVVLAFLPGRKHED
jgi:hypothetical protein